MVLALAVVGALLLAVLAALLLAVLAALLLALPKIRVKLLVLAATPWAVVNRTMHRMVRMHLTISTTAGCKLVNRVFNPLANRVINNRVLPPVDGSAEIAIPEIQ